MAWINPTINNLSQFLGNFNLINTKESSNSKLKYNPTYGNNTFFNYIKGPFVDYNPAVTFNTKQIGFDIKTTKELTNKTNDTTKLESQFLSLDKVETPQITFGLNVSTSNAVSKFNPTYDDNVKLIPDSNLKQFEFGINNGANYTSATIYDEVTKQYLNRYNTRLFLPEIYNLTNPDGKLNSNSDPEAGLASGIGAVGTIGAGLFGVPAISNVVGNFLQLANPAPTYLTLNYDNLFNIPGVYLQDFRAMRILTGNVSKIRLDGISAAIRGSVKGAIYAGASAIPTGPYIAFNLDGPGKLGYGWGSHDDRYAIRTDFTMRSQLATRWSGNKFKLTLNPIERFTPFRGDKVNVIDFSKRALDSIYQYKPDLGIESLNSLRLDETQDFIKFYITGPNLVAGNESAQDDVIVFRATIKQLDDRFSPDWIEQKMVGRADKNYTYQGYSRDVDLQFTVYATDRDEVKPIWRKLNALAGYTAPTYDKNTIAMIAPWIRITIGDLFVQQPAIISSLSYTLHDQDTTWEINLENDPQMMQTPHKIEVSLGLNMITDFVPQNKGKFYSLAKEFDTNGQPLNGNRNWLSDFNKNPRN